jgi:2,3-bisphosphoglycerate-independent phosphoglycerate mutase
MLGIILKSFSGIVAVLPDHPTPIRVKTHTNVPVPFVVKGKGTDRSKRFTEREAAKGKFGTIEASLFLDMLFTP